jgi:hypothetical protein
MVEVTVVTSVPWLEVVVMMLVEYEYRVDEIVVVIVMLASDVLVIEIVTAGFA